MGDLVHQGDVDLVFKLVEIFGNVDEGLTVKHDPIGEFAVTVLSAFGESDAVVQAEKGEAAVLWTCFSDKYDVVEPIDHLVGEQVELFDNQHLEFFFSEGVHPAPYRLRREEIR